MSRLKGRRGAGLAELVVVLTLAAIVSAAAAAALAGADRYLRSARTRSEARRILREAAAVLAADLRTAPADSLRVRGDSALDFTGLVGVSAVCVSAGTALVLPPDATSGGVPYSSWRAAPEMGDVVAVFDTVGGGVWRTALVDSSSTRSDGAGCRPSSGLMTAADSAARRPVTRVVLQSPLAPVAVGAPVRVMRNGRYALTRASDGSWSLSYRRCTGSSCAVAQPVAGPFAAPADSGVVFTRAAADSGLDVALRSAAINGLSVHESSRFRIALRNHAVVFP